MSYDLLYKLSDRLIIGEPCWSWNGHHNHEGYGIVGHEGRKYRVHRVMYEMLVGPIPDGLEPDHLCKNTGCWRPDHLELVTHAENLRRAGWGEAHRQRQREKTHCVHGHEFTPENTLIREGTRRCRVCTRKASREHKRRIRQMDMG